MGSNLHGDSELLYRRLVQPAWGSVSGDLGAQQLPTSSMPKIITAGLGKVDAKYIRWSY